MGLVLGLVLRFRLVVRFVFWLGLILGSFVVAWPRSSSAISIQDKPVRCILISSR